MKKLIVCSAMMASLAVFAGSAEPDGTDFVVTAAAGESFTNSAAIGDYARLVKKGAGEVVLTAATTAFKGATVVEAGTLAITDLKALGTGTPVTVESGATFWIKTPCTTGGQTTDRFNGHTVTIAGTGADGKGAFRYTQTSGDKVADNMLSHLVLSDDATVEVASRWGLYKSDAILELNGHTLTRVGGSNWMIFNHITSSDGPGTVVSTAGTLTLQGTPALDENVTLVITNGCTLGLWGHTSRNIKGKIVVCSGRTLQGQSGTTASVNHVGDVHVAGTSGTAATLSVWYNNNARAMSVDGALTGDNGVGVSCTGEGGSLWLNGDIDLPGSANNFTAYCAYLYMNTEAWRNMRLVLRDGNTTTLGGGSLLARMLRIANGGAVSGAFRQTGGVFAVPSGDNGRIGEGSGSRGYYTLEGGEFHASNTTFIAEKPGSFGAFRQTGGLFAMRNEGGAAALRVGYGGSGLLVQTGGTNDVLVTNNSQNGGLQMCTNGLSEATISGTGTLFRASLVQFNAAGSVCTNILNILDGAVVKANRFRKQTSATAGARAYVNADGGTLMPTFAWDWTASITGMNYARSPDHFVVWRKGLVIDTSENATAAGAGSTPVPFWFESPTGRGVESVALPTDSAFASAKYIGVARVVFEDATGWGASAYAEYDFATKKLSKIVVTSRGCDYSDGAKAYLESPDRKSRYACALTLSSNAGMCGEFVKRGAPTLELYATNTITGGIAVESGALNACTGGVIPSNTPVRVEAGATLNLFEHPVVLSTFTGAGQVINGAVTVTNAVRATCAELFAGKHATFAGNLTFAPGAAFTITDPENLAAYAHSASATAFTAASVNGTPTLAFEGDAPQGVKWSLFKKNATTYNFGPVTGTMLLLK